ncbi:MAG: hypothetical protein LIO96_11175, partial [Lachnospiraceae bacterium]|nr:hypothetical protein [Lachnospiraceae bacterium]
VEKILNNSFINYLSDLFIIAMVVMWIIDNVYESIVASVVTFSSVILSFQTGNPCYDTSMWSSIGTNIAIPLGAGGAVWLVKCGVQHAIANHNGKQAHMDFPKVPDTEDDGIEELYSEEEEGEVG